MLKRVIPERKGNTPPEKGGCWYCFSTEGTNWFFSCEFDCNLHEECLYKQIEREIKDLGGLDVETSIMAKEFGIIDYKLNIELEDEMKLDTNIF